MAFYMIAAGIVGSLLAAVFGAIDFLAIPRGNRAKRIGAINGVGNVIVVALFAISWLLRWADPSYPSTLAYLCSYAGAGLSLATGWLGGELVDRLGVGIDDRAHLDAPSSLCIIGPAIRGQPPAQGVSSPDRKEMLSQWSARADRLSRTFHANSRRRQANRKG